MARYSGGRTFTYYRLESAQGGYVGTSNKLSSARRLAISIANKYGYKVVVYKAKRNALRETKGEIVFTTPSISNPSRLIPLKGISVKGRTVTFVGNPGVLKRYKKKLTALAKRLVK